MFLMTSTSTDRIVYVYKLFQQKKDEGKNLKRDCCCCCRGCCALARLKYRKFNNNFRLNGHLLRDTVSYLFVCLFCLLQILFSLSSSPLLLPFLRLYQLHYNTDSISLEVERKINACVCAFARN